MQRTRWVPFVGVRGCACVCMSACVRARARARARACPCVSVRVCAYARVRACVCVFSACDLIRANLEDVGASISHVMPAAIAIVVGVIIASI